MSSYRKPSYQAFESQQGEPEEQQQVIAVENVIGMDLIDDDQASNAASGDLGAVTHHDYLADIWSNRVFPFFELSAELRNLVYGYVTQPFAYNAHVVKDPSSPGRLTIHVTIYSDAYLLPGPRLLCRQFRREYEAEVLKSAAVTIEVDSDHRDGVHSEEELSRAKVLIKDQLQNVVVLFRYISLEDMTFSEMLQAFEAGAHRLLDELPNVKNLQLCLNMHASDIEELVDEEEGALQPFFALDVLASYNRPQATSGVVVKKKLLVINGLYSVNNKVVNDDKLASAFSDAEGNFIVYIATIATDSANS